MAGVGYVWLSGHIRMMRAPARRPIIGEKLYIPYTTGNFRYETGAKSMAPILHQPYTLCRPWGPLSRTGALRLSTAR